MLPFHPFRRLRLRSNPPPPRPVSSEDDSDESSPERGRPHIIHIAAPKSWRRSRQSTMDIPDRAPAKLTDSTHITLTLGGAPPEPPSKKPSKPGVVSVTHPTDSVDALQPSAKSTLIRRVTSKLTISIPSKSSSRGSRRTSPGDMPPPHTQGPRPRVTIPVSPTLPNSFVSKEHREAALRERGLLPPRRDLSEQERVLDERLRCIPSPASTTFNGLSEAERFKAGWLAANRTSESSNSDCGPLQGTNTLPQSMLAPPSSSVPPDADVLRRSSESKTDLPPMGRPSLCSSVPPLSPSSYLGVLLEEPSEHAPFTPPPLPSPSNLPIIVSSTPEFTASPIMAESPISCTFSSQCAGSAPESRSQLDHPVSAKEGGRLSASRRRTTDSGDRGRKVVGSSLSNLGTRSLSNLRRSVTERLRSSSSSVLSTADLHPTTQVRRTAISPTIHNPASILKATGGIEDVESRRLSELAFLD